MGDVVKATITKLEAALKDPETLPGNVEKILAELQKINEIID